MFKIFLALIKEFGPPTMIGAYRNDTIQLQLHSNVSEIAITCITEVLNNLILNIPFMKQKFS